MKLLNTVRSRFHPLWRLRRSRAWRWLQRSFDLVVYVRIPETGLSCALKLLRDASVIFNSQGLEVEVRTAFRLLLDILQPAVVWDVGANIGFYSWFVRQHPAVKHVVMIEPDPTNYALINRTIKRNGCRECTTYNMALADQVGNREFLTDPYSGACGSLLAVSEAGNELSIQHSYGLSETISCNTATVDSLIAEGAPAPGLMKIDVEGGEQLVLAGAANCLAINRPALIIETGNLAVLDTLRNAGYRAYRIDNNGNYLFISAAEERDLGPIERAFERV